MALVGTPQTLVGVVRSVELEAHPEWARGGEVPLKVKCQMELADGLGAYVDTSAGVLAAGGFRPVKPGVRPWAIAGDVDPDTGIEDEPILMVRAGDRLAVAATVGERKVSRRGNAYVSANRAQIVQWSRPGGTAPVPPTVPAPVTREDTCPHGVVVYRAGDCERCDPPVPTAADLNGRARVTDVTPPRPTEEALSALRVVRAMLGLPPLDTAGLSAAQVAQSLADAINQQGGRAPEVLPPAPAPRPAPRATPQVPQGPRWPAQQRPAPSRPAPSRGPRPSGDGQSPDDAVAALRRAMGGS